MINPARIKSLKQLDELETIKTDRCFNLCVIADEVKETDNQPIKHWDIQYEISCTFLGTKEEAIAKAKDDGDWLGGEVGHQGMMLKECTVYYNGEPEELTLKDYLEVYDG